MQLSIFREYDIRGKVGTELMLDQVGVLGAAIAYYFYQKNPQVKTVLVGMDTRSSSPAIKEALCAALQECGLDIIFIGVCPAPVLYFGLYTLPVDAGLMITASHNPPEYNGIKMSLGRTFIWGDAVREIGRLYEQGKKPEIQRKGTYTTDDLITEYINYMYKHFPTLHGASLHAAIDLGASTGATVIPALVKKFDFKQVELLCAEVNAPPKHEADPVVEKNMKCVREALKKGNFELGVGLDGDADRMAAMTQDGHIVPGDRLLAIFAQPIVQQHPGTAVVADIKSSQALLDLLASWGAHGVLSPSGHAIIKDTMHKHHALLGGELSCHFFFHDRYFGYDDAIYAMLRLFEILVQSRKSLEELLAIFPPTISSPEFRLPCLGQKKKEAIEKVKKYFEKIPDAKLIMIDGVRTSLPYGWGLIRASNTQDVLSFRFEADAQENLKRIIREFIKALQGMYSEADFGL